jgi:hypothetical protein
MIGQMWTSAAHNNCVSLLRRQESIERREMTMDSRFRGNDNVVASLIPKDARKPLRQPPHICRGSERLTT